MHLKELYDTMELFNVNNLNMSNSTAVKIEMDGTAKLTNSAPVPIVIERYKTKEDAHTFTGFHFSLHRKIWQKLKQLYRGLWGCFFETYSVEGTGGEELIERWVFQKGKFVKDNERDICTKNTLIYLSSTDDKH